MFVKLSLKDFNILSFDFIFVLVKHKRMPLGKFARNLNKNRQEEEDQENVIVFDFNTR